MEPIYQSSSTVERFPGPTLKMTKREYICLSSSKRLERYSGLLEHSNEADAMVRMIAYGSEWWLEEAARVFRRRAAAMRTGVYLVDVDKKKSSGRVERIYAVFSDAIARTRSILGNRIVIDDTRTTIAGEGEVEGTSRPSKWMWLVPLVFLFFLVQALVGGAILPTLAWLSLLVNGVLVASGLYKRSRALSYLAFAFSLLGLLLLVTSIVRDFFS